MSDTTAGEVGAARRSRCRRAMSDDLEPLVELRVEMFRAMGVDVDSPDWQKAAHDWFARRLDHPEFGIYVVEVEGAVASSAVGAIRDAAPSPACPAGRDVLINNVCTFPQYRGSGFGRQAFAAVMEWARATGVERAELMATGAGRRMYEREGFAQAQWPAMRAPL